MKKQFYSLVGTCFLVYNTVAQIPSGSYTIGATISGKPHLVSGKISLGTSIISKKIYVLDDTRNFDGVSDGNIFSIFQNISPVGYVTQEYISGSSGGKLEIGFASSGYASGYINYVYANRGTIISRNTSGLILRSTPGSGYYYDGITFQTGAADWNGVTPERMRIDGSGNVGIGTTSPQAKLNLSNGNIQLDNGDVFVRDYTKGIVLKSPSSICWRITIDDSGNFVKNMVGCPN